MNSKWKGSTTRIVSLDTGITVSYSDRLKKNLLSVNCGGTAIRHEMSLSCDQIRVLSVEPMVWLSTHSEGTR